MCLHGKYSLLAGSSRRRRRAGSSDLATDEIDPADAACTALSPATGASWPYLPAEWWWIPDDDDDCGGADAGAPPACQKGMWQRFQSFPPPESPPAGACLSSPEIAIREVTSVPHPVRTERLRRGPGTGSLLSHSPRSCNVIKSDLLFLPFHLPLSLQCVPCILDLVPFIAPFPVDFYFMACGLRLLCLLLLATVKPIMGP